VTETMASDRTVWTSPRRFWFVLGLVIVSFILGVSMGKREPEDTKIRLNNSEKERAKLKDERIALQNEVSEWKNKFNIAQANLDAIRPSPNVYKIRANQSQIIPYGDLTIGLVNTPGSQSVNLNINDKHYSAAAGEVINIATVTCRVEVMSFDALKSQVVVNASCAEAKH
jgi:hypothetical protein